MILGPKMTHFLHFGHNKIFLKLQNCHFYQFFNTCHQVQYQKIIMYRFREKLKYVDFGPKNDRFTPFYLKKSFVTLIYRILTLCKKSRKSNEPILRKRHYRRMDKAGFIGPSQTARGLKIFVVFVFSETFKGKIRTTDFIITMVILPN